MFSIAQSEFPFDDLADEIANHGGFPSAILPCNSNTDHYHDQEEGHHGKHGGDDELS